jgi:inner membrane protein
MTAPTHIIGGLTFTGIMCSFFDINVFEKPAYLALCAVCSILPDIDTTKSAIGKILFPIAIFINRKFGHRTITHSLPFFLLIWALFSLGRYFTIIEDQNVLKIALFALLSHFILDMLTVQGIPMMYPFLQNACVIPGDYHYRFKTGDPRHELIVSGVFLLLCVTMQPLFSNGFWTSYNRMFGTIQHVDRENNNTAFYVVCEYSYVENAELITGEALVLESKKNELVLFDQTHVFKLSADNPQIKINYTKPKISTVEKRFQKLQFFGIRLDSLHRLLGNTLASGLIQSNHNIRYIDNAVTYYTNFVQFSNRFNFQILAGEDSIKFENSSKIAKLEAAIWEDYQVYAVKLSEYKEHHQRISELQSALTDNGLSNYERNKLQDELLKLKSAKKSKPKYIYPAAKYAELEALKKSVSDRHLAFSGNITLYQFGYEPSTGAQEPQPLFDPTKLSLAMIITQPKSNL